MLPRFKLTRRTLLLVIILALLLIAFLIRNSLLGGIAGFLIVNDPLAPSDIIVALTGSDERVRYAVQLFHRGLSSRLAFTGSGDKPLLSDWGYIDIAKAYAVKQGVPEDAIFEIPSFGGTYEEALQVRKFMEEHGLQSAVIVSSPPHMRRVQMIFHKVLGSQVKLILVPVPLERSYFDLQNWWKDKESLQSVVMEYLKLSYYYFKYVFLN